MTSTIEPHDLSELKKSVETAAARITTFSLAFLTYCVALAFGVGAITHRKLLVASPIKLPKLPLIDLSDIELSLVAFFVVSPILLVALHLLVLTSLGEFLKNLNAYEAVLQRTVRKRDERILIRRRLNAFGTVQLFANADQEHRTFADTIIRLSVWGLLIFPPIFLLIQTLVTFLPYHSEPVSWLHRLLIVADLAIVWVFWRAFRRQESKKRNLSDRRAVGTSYGLFWRIVGVVSAVLIACFSFFFATYPGERLHGNVAARAVDAIFGISKVLFGGDLDEVTNKSRSVFANVLLLPSEAFVDDATFEKSDSTLNLRGRDLRGAILIKSDLRKADFTGANLDGARLDHARLEGARFGCARTRSQQGNSDGPIRVAPLSAYNWPDDGCTWLRHASLLSTRLSDALLDGAWLEGAELYGAELRGASLRLAKMQGAVLQGARLEGAVLYGAYLQGASLQDARLAGASLSAARCQGASFKGAKLHGASFFEAKCQGAIFDSAELMGTVLLNAQLQGASFDRTDLEGAQIAGAELDGARLRSIAVWRTRGRPSSSKFVDILGLETRPDPDFTRKLEPNDKRPAFQQWMEEIASSVPSARAQEVRERLQFLDPELPTPIDATPSSFWEKMRADSPALDDYRQWLVKFLIEEACHPEAMPFVARGFIHNGRLATLGNQLPKMIAQLKDHRSCKAAANLNSHDLRALGKLYDD